MKKRNVICAALLAGAMAVSAMSMGFAAWQTNITGSGNVAASGKWDVAITDASLNLSSGASATREVTTYELERTGVKDDTLIAATISSSTWVQDAALVAPRDVLSLPVLVVPGLGKFSLGMRCASSGAG